MGGNVARELGVFRRIDVDQPAAQHCDRSPAGVQGASVRRSIDAAGEAADHREPGAHQAGGQPLSLGQAVVRGVPGADDRHAEGILRQQRAANEEQSRRIGDFAECSGILRRLERHERDAVPLANGQFLLNVDLFLGRGDPQTQLSAYAWHLAKLAGRGGEDRLGGAETRQQGLPEPGSDPRNEAQSQNGLDCRVGHAGIPDSDPIP